MTGMASKAVGLEDDGHSPHKLSPIEERVWDRAKREENTREDWEDLNATLVAFKRRYIARHTKESTRRGSGA